MTHNARGRSTVWIWMLFACAVVGLPLKSSADDRGRPGADPVRIRTFLAELARADRLICDLVGDQLGNFRSGAVADIGRFADADAQLQAVTDSLASPTTDPQAVEYLATQLDHDNACVRRVAAKMLGRSAISNDRLAALLRSDSPRVREAAAYAIGEGERQSLRVPLERALGDRATAVAVMAAWALGEIQDRASIPALTQSLRRGDTRLRITAVWALGETEDPGAVREITSALRDANATVRAIAAQALGDIGQPASAAALAAALSDSDAEVRYQAAEALGDLDDLRAAPPALVRAASTEEPRLRLAVARALREIADPATIQALTSLASDPERNVRLAAVKGLSEIGTRAVAGALTKALSDSDPQVREAAAEGLGEALAREE